MRRFILCTLVTAAVLYGGSACSGDDTSDGDSPSGPPTQDMIADEAGVYFPASVHSFRLTSLLEGNQVDATFQMAASDVDEFTTKSKFELTEGLRTIAHSSPIWGTPDYVSTQFFGAQSTFNTVVRSVEVTYNDKVLAAAASSTTSTTSPNGNVAPELGPIDPDDVTVRLSLSPEEGTGPTTTR